MRFATDLLADLMTRMSCIGAIRDAADKWLDCIEAKRQGFRSSRAPLCPRCKVKRHLDELFVDLTAAPAPVRNRS